MTNESPEASTPQPTLLSATLDQLKLRLLDLSKRNRLINFRSKRSANIAIVDELPAEVFRILAVQKKAMRFKAIAKTEDADEDTADQDALPLPIDLPEVAEPQNHEAHFDLWLQTNLKSEALDNKLRRLADQAKLVIEEQGVNALFLALGMLQYFESDSSEIPLKAPLLLLPVTLERRSAGQPFAVRTTDDDPVVNPALSEMLSQQFGIRLPEVPDVTDGLDPVPFFEELKKAVAGRTRWDVTAEISLGLFSFQKFVMYKDLERNRDLFEQHPLIAMLAERSGEGGLGLPKDVAELVLDKEFTPEETFQVVDADSSQQRAIAAVARGHSMVLQGPPGTGKSQTITNLIANALATGKTVLFVSEKMAALQVVSGRLQNAKLGDFCLELHSNHSNKKAFLKEVQRSLNNTLTAPAELPSIAARLRDVRASLTDYVQALHTKVEPLGWTPYRAYGELAAIDKAPVVPLGPGAEALTETAFEDVGRRVNDLATVVSKVGNLKEHPWRDVGLPFMGGETRRTVEQSIASTLEACQQFTQLSKTAVDAYGLPASTHVSDGQRALEIASVLERSPGVPEKVFASHDWQKPPDLALQLIDMGRRYVAGRQAALERFRPDVLEQDHSRGAAVVGRLGGQLLRMLSPEYREVRKAWLAMRQPGYEPSIQQQLVHLKEIETTRKWRSFLEDHNADGERLFGPHWRGTQSDWSALSAYLDWIVEFRAVYVKHGLGRQVADQVVHPHPDVTVLRQLAETADRVEIERLHLSTVLQWPNGYLAEKSVLDVARRVNELRTADGGFSDWRAYTAAVGKVQETLVAPIAERLVDGSLAPDQALLAFKRAFVEKWLDRVIESRPLLRDFSAMSHEARLEEFRQLDRRVLIDNQSRIQRVVRDRIQESMRTLAGTDAMRHLRTQMAKSRGHASLRNTLRISYPALQTIKPCFMMSPMTVAQFLDPRRHRFDLVIFDEASQMTAEDAVGAVLRGEQLTVVGDPKQLPPTNFFAVQSGQVEASPNEEGEATVEDFESILEQFQAAGAPSAQLRWHYRSRHESLIAFSNATYYDRELLTFPSPDTDRTVRGLQFEYVSDGVYEGNGLNRVEARRVAEAVIAHARQHPEQSLGVGTFSLRQQLAIQDEIERLRRENPELEMFFEPAPERGFFVKNLENIQGDDRDVIFLSVTYAKGAEGRLRHNFGPINGPNGWRRLNVLITRARLALRVFSSMHGDEIDLTKVTSQGARNLREFLLFAESDIVTPTRVDAEASTDSAFEDDVFRELSQQGIRLVPQVGVAGYRIDFGVLDDEVQGRFICGIECDGASYHSAETARDRDRLREEVLKGLGWQLVRVWSTDWFMDRKSALHRLLESIKRCRQTAQVADAQAAVDGTQSAAEHEPDETAHPDIGADRSGMVQHDFSVDGVSPQLATTSPQTPYSRAYLKSDLRRVQQVGVLAANMDTLRYLMGQVVAAEGPVHQDDAFSRVAGAMGDQKVGSRITARLERVARDGQESGLWVYRNPFLYRRDGVINVRNRADSGIPAERVALEEYQEAVKKVLDAGGPCSRETVVTGVRTLLGFNRTGSKLQALIDQAIDLLIADGVVGHAAEGLGLRDDRSGDGV